MKILNSHPLSFGAVYLNNYNIGKLDKSTNEYRSVPSSFLLIDPQNSNDIEALYNVSKYWENSKYSTNIYYAACAIRDNNKFYNKNKVFVLSSQLDDFNKLDDRKILGIMHVRELEPKHYFGEHIEARPDLYYSVMPEYKGVGSAMNESLKRLCNKISVFPVKLKSVRNFIKRMGYIEQQSNSNLFVWYRNIFDRK